MRPFIPDKPLLGAALAALGEPPGRLLVAGSARMAGALSKKGFEVTAWQLGEPEPEPELGAKSADAGPQASGDDIPVQWLGPIESPPPGLGRYRGLLLVDALTPHADPLPALCALTSGLAPGAAVLVAEAASDSGGGRWLLRLWGRLARRPVLVEPGRIAELCLNAGVQELRQSWPQGLRSLVLTRGRVHPLAHLLATQERSHG